jgi:hypothetical protein
MLPVSTNSQLDEAAINKIVKLAYAAVDDLPESFGPEFKKWAQGTKERQSSSCMSPWMVQVKPYALTELSKLPGMPGRTRMYEILHEAGIPKQEWRGGGGQLRVSTVKVIVESVARGGVSRPV